MAVEGLTHFKLKVSGMGIFPDVRRPRVVWIGLTEEGDNLIRLHKGVEAELKETGFPSEDRRFTPHITLGRIRSNRNIGKLLKLTDAEKGVKSGSFEVSDINLIKSELKPSGAVYTELSSVMLSSGH